MADTKRDDTDCPELGTVIFEDTCRAEIRVIGPGQLGFAAQFPPEHWDWIVLREVQNLGEVRRLCEALGHESRQ